MSVTFTGTSEELTEPTPQNNADYHESKNDRAASSPEYQVHVLDDLHAQENLGYRKSCKVSLGVIFSFQSFVVVAAFVIMTVYSVVTMRQTSVTLVYQRLDQQMQKFDQLLMQPMQLGEGLLLSLDQQMRREEPDVSYFCNDSVGFDNGSKWYKTFDLFDGYVASSSDILQAFFVFESDQFTEYAQLRDGSHGHAPQLSGCNVQRDSIFFDKNGTGSKYPSVHNLSEEEFIAAGQEGSPKPFQLATRTVVAIQNMEESIGWFTETYYDDFAKKSYITEVVAQPLKRSDGSRYRNSFTNQIGISMQATAESLQTVPDTSVGIASLYDLKGDALIATSADFSVLYPNSSERDFYPANATPRADMNEWYRESQRRCANILKTGNTTLTCTGTYEYGDRLISHRTMGLSSGLHLMLLISDAKHFYYEQTTRVKNVLIGVGVACACVSIIACVVVVLAIRMPLSRVVRNMLQAARFRNSEVTTLSPWITEMALLVRGFASMNSRLKAAQPFIPQAVLMTFQGDRSKDHDESEDEGDADIETAISGAEKTPGDSPRSNNESTSSHHQIGSFSSKRVGIVAVNVRGISKVPSLEVTLPSIVNNLVTAVQICVEAERGVIDSYHGDHFVLMFNTVRPAAAAGRRVACTALAIANHLGRTAEISRVAIGGALGMCSVGMLGNAAVQRYTVFGSAYARAIALMEASGYIEKQLEGLADIESLPYPNCCVAGPIIDSSVRRDTEGIANPHLVGLYKPHAAADAFLRLASTARSSDETISRRNSSSHGAVAVAADANGPAFDGERVWGLLRDVERRDVNADEWMYELQSTDADLLRLSGVMDALVERNWAEANELLQELVGNDTSRRSSRRSSLAGRRHSPANDEATTRVGVSAVDIGGSGRVSPTNSSSNGNGGGKARVDLHETRSVPITLLIARLRVLTRTQGDVNVMAAPWWPS